MKKLFSIFSLAIISFGIHSQQIYKLDLPLDSTAFLINNCFDTSGIQNNKKFDFDLSLNMGYSYSTVFGGGQNIGVSPVIKYTPNKKFILTVGSRLMYSRLNNAKFSGQFNSTHPYISNSNDFGVFLFTKGIYNLNSRLSITGIAYKNFPQNNYSLYHSSYLNNLNFQGASLGIDYKIFKNVSVGAHFNVIQMQGLDYYNNGYMPYYEPSW